MDMSIIKAIRLISMCLTAMRSIPAHKELEDMCGEESCPKTKPHPRRLPETGGITAG